MDTASDYTSQLTPVLEVWCSNNLLPQYVEPMLWFDYMDDTPTEIAGCVRDIDELKLRGYYCPLHGQLKDKKEGCIEGCGYLRYSEQLNLEDDFYSTPEDEIDWNTIEGLNTTTKLFMWRKIILRGAGENDYQFLIQKIIESRIKSLTWQIESNQWFFMVGGNVYWRRPSWSEIRIKFRYYEGLLHLIRQSGKLKSECDAYIQYSPYDI